MPDRMDQLLDKALQSLEPGERDELLRGLLLARADAAVSLTAGLGRLQGVAASAPPVDSERLGRLLGGEPPSGVRMRVLPVRLPEIDHERLRRFCQARGFSMAVVVRTLVERFLDEHATTAQPGTAASAAGLK